MSCLFNLFVLLISLDILDAALECSIVVMEQKHELVMCEPHIQPAALQPVQVM